MEQNFEAGESLDARAIPFTKEDLEETIIAIDTKEKMDWLLNGLEDGEIQLVSREWTEEEKEQFSKALAICKARHKEKRAKEAGLTKVSSDTA